jgi:hypothetical protein
MPLQQIDGKEPGATRNKGTTIVGHILAELHIHSIRQYIGFSLRKHASEAATRIRTYEFCCDSRQRIIQLTHLGNGLKGT